MAGHRKWSELRTQMSPEQRARIDAAADEMVRVPPLSYPAIVTTEGQFTLAEFPDCPGCQTFVGPHQELMGAAMDALEGWLAVHVDDGDSVPRPTVDLQPPEGGQIIQVPVAPELAVRLRMKGPE